MLTTACCSVVGVVLGLDFVLGWLVVMRHHFCPSGAAWLLELTMV